MNDRADAERVSRAMPNTPTMDDEQQRFDEAHFTQRQWQRLVFLRWLYCQGLLTEWPYVGAAKFLHHPDPGDR